MKKKERPHSSSVGTKDTGRVNRGPASLSDSTVINIAMNSLSMLQEKFGPVEFVRAPGDEPALLVLPKTLDVCLTCGIIIERGAQSYCAQHTPASPVPANPVVELAQDLNTAFS